MSPGVGHPFAVLRMKPGANLVVGRILNLKGEWLTPWGGGAGVPGGREHLYAAHLPERRHVVAGVRLDNDKQEAVDGNLPTIADGRHRQRASETPCETPCETPSTTGPWQSKADTFDNVHLPRGLFKWKVVPKASIHVGQALQQRGTVQLVASCPPSPTPTSTKF